MTSFTPFIENFCARYQYPAEAVEAFRSLFGRLSSEEDFRASFEELRGKYLACCASLGDTLPALHALAAEKGVREETLDFVFLLSMVEDLWVKYKFIGMEEAVYWRTMDDLRCKLLECIENRGVPGTFVTSWFDGFFRLARFGFGRFQYEISRFRLAPGGDPLGVKLPSGRLIRPDEIYINFHIPSSGIPLTDEVRYDSYRDAYRRLSPLFPDGKVLFGCGSWLLYPRMKEFLPPHMNILKFQNDFHIIAWAEKDEFHDAWRLYGHQSGKAPADLPRDTSFRRAYADWLLAGNKAGDGYGFFLFDGEKITH
ncbi:MAG: DUF5596 domain-containing protein [Clostridia bacterium]|nr:DUF5596 domain-containing protein [Clostridia bacterium]